MVRKPAIMMVAALLCMALDRDASATQPPDSVYSDNGSDTAMGPYDLSGLSTGYQNTAAGYLTLDNITSGFKNSGFGYLVLSGNISGIDNAAFGANALVKNAGSGSYNAALGADALSALGNGVSYNTAVGAQAAYGSTSGVANVAIGADAMYTNTSGESNTAVGYSALHFDQTGWYDVAIGHSAMLYFEGSENIAVGFSALLGNGGGGSSNVALGGTALENAQNNDNTGIGYAALGQDTTGAGNIGLGYLAGVFPTTGSSNIEIGNVGNGPDEILPTGSILDTNLTRLGTPGVQSQTYIAGIYGIPVSGNPVHVNSQGQLGVVVSSQRFKTRLSSMASPDKLSRLRPVTFQLKLDPVGPRQYGLIAEEVAKIYPALVIRDENGRVDGVRYEELTPLLLRKLQLQDQQLRRLQAQWAEFGKLRSQIAEARMALLKRQESG